MDPVNNRGEGVRAAAFAAVPAVLARLGADHSANSVSGAPAMLYDGLGEADIRTMDVTEFEDLIDRLGEDVSRWPDDRRLSAEQLLSRSAEAQALLAQAQALRAALAAPPVRAPAGLADRIVAAATKRGTDATEALTEGETARG
ncbi:hypothetical protein ACVWW6_006823 [Bradyrhizobium sp. USDA 3311]